MSEGAAGGGGGGGGYGWVVVFGACVCNFLHVGLNRSMGIFFEVFLEKFQDTAAATATFLAIANTLRMVLAPVVSMLCERLGCRVVVMCGGFLYGLSFILTTFAQNILHLNLTYGLVCGVGAAAIFTPPYIIVGEYFEKNTGRAMSLSTIGAGIGTIAMAPLENLLIEHYGSFGALLITGGIVFNIIVAGALFRPLRRNKGEGVVMEVVVGEGEEGNGADGGRGSKGHKGMDGGNGGEEGNGTNGENEKGCEGQNEKGGSGNKGHKGNEKHKGYQGWRRNKGHKHKEYKGKKGNVEGIDEDFISSLSCEPKEKIDANDDLLASYDNRMSVSVEQAKGNEELWSGALNSSIDDLDTIEPLHPLGLPPDTLTTNLTHNSEAITDNNKSKRWSWLREKLEIFSYRTFWLYMFNICCMGFVLMTPMIYLPSLALEMGASKNTAALLLSVVGLMDIVGRFLFGFLFDLQAVQGKRRRRLMFGLLGICFGLSTALIGACPELISLSLAAAVYGMMEGGYHSQRITVLHEFLPASLLPTAIGWSIFAQGIGQLTSSPSLGALKDRFGTFRLGYFVGGALFCAQSVPLIVDYCCTERHSKAQARHSEALSQHSDTELRHSDTEMRHSDTERRHSDTEMQHSDTEMQHSDTEMQHSDTEMRHSDTEMRHSETLSRHSETLSRHSETPSAQCPDSKSSQDQKTLPPDASNTSAV